MSAIPFLHRILGQVADRRKLLQGSHQRRLTIEPLAHRCLLTTACEVSTDNSSDGFCCDVYGSNDDSFDDNTSGDAYCGADAYAGANEYGGNDSYCGEDGYGGTDDPEAPTSYGDSDCYGSGHDGTAEVEGQLIIGVELLETPVEGTQLSEWMINVEIDGSGAQIGFEGIPEGYEIESVSVSQRIHTFRLVLPTDTSCDISINASIQGETALSDTFVIHF